MYLDFFTNQRCFIAFSPLQQVQCLQHGATFVPLHAPIISSQSRIGDNSR